MTGTAVYLLVNSLEAGGAERLNIALVKAWKPSGIFLLEDKIEYPLQDFPVRIQSLSPYRQIKGGLKYLFSQWYARKLAAHLKQEPAQKIILLASLPRSLDVACRARNLLQHDKNIKVIAWEHANPDYSQRGRMLKNLTHRLYQASDLICTNSRNAYSFLESVYQIPAAKLAVFYNFFDPDEIHKLSRLPIPEEHASWFGPETLLYTGRLHEHKGIEFLLQVFADVVIKQRNAKLVFVGKGSLQGYIENFRKKNHLQNQILLAGYTPNPYAYLSRARALVFPSENEGFGNVIVESLLCGTPVISADIDNGPREIMAPETPFTFRTPIPEKTKAGWLLPSPHRYTDKKNIHALWVNTLVDFLQQEPEPSLFPLAGPNTLPSFHVEHQVTILHEILKRI